LAGLIPTLKKQRGEHFMMPTSDILNPDIPELLEKGNIKWTRATMYHTVASDLSDLSDVKYDILVFFSPEGIRSLFKNFPNFKQENTRIAAFGNTTHQAIEENALRLDIQVPTPKFSSVLWMVSPWPLERGVQVMVGAPKRRFKHAVDRNRIKRLLRESYRLERADHFKSSPPLLLAFLYQGDDRVALNELQRHMSSALSKIAEKAIH
jgi:ribonuclease P protein component